MLDTTAANSVPTDGKRHKTVNRAEFTGMHTSSPAYVDEDSVH